MKSGTWFDFEHLCVCVLEVSVLESSALCDCAIFLYKSKGHLISQKQPKYNRGNRYSKNTGLFQPIFGSNMDKPNHWVEKCPYFDPNTL